MKKWYLVLLILVVAVIGWQFFGRDADSTGKARQGRSEVPVPVETCQVRQDSVRDVGVFTGSLEPKSQFTAAPKVSGWLRRLLVNVGDTVSPNQVIAILDDTEFTQEVEQARAELAVARANSENYATDLDIAEREYERSRALREKQIASVSELDESEAAFNAARTRHKVSLAQVTQKEAALKTAEVRLSYTQVRAFWKEGEPVRVVGERFVDEGALLQANEPVVSILENNPLIAIVYVIERDYPKVQIGQQAEISTDAYPDRRFVGRIIRIAPLLRESSRQARVEIEVPNPDLVLMPGMFVRSRVVFSTHEQATVVPVASLVKRNGVDGVFLVDGVMLKARFVQVTTGVVDNERAEILTPVLSGWVITLGNHLLEEGSTIILPAAEGEVP